MTKLTLLLPQRIANALALFSLASLAFMVLGCALQWGTANVYSYALQAWHQRWANDFSEQLTQNNLSVADSVSSSMVAWQPLLAHYQILNAKQIEWNNFYHLVLNPQTENKAALNTQNLARVQGFYLQAIALRPSWPNTYVDMADLSLRQGAALPDVWAYLNAAQEVAPSAAATLLGVVKLGFVQWPALSQAQRQQVISALFQLTAHGGTHRLLEASLADPQARQRACATLVFAGRANNIRMCR